jgi:hypothetical protein
MGRVLRGTSRRHGNGAAEGVVPKRMLKEDREKLAKILAQLGASYERSTISAEIKRIWQATPPGVAGRKRDPATYDKIMLSRHLMERKLLIMPSRGRRWGVHEAAGHVARQMTKAGYKISTSTVENYWYAVQKHLKQRVRSII